MFDRFYIWLTKICVSCVCLTSCIQIGFIWFYIVSLGFIQVLIWFI